jgi:hypothetical protein
MTADTFRIRRRTSASGEKLTGVMRPRERVTLLRLLTWVYRDQKADQVAGRGKTAPTAEAGALAGGCFVYGASSAATVELNGMMGTVIQSTAWRQRPVLHDDAEAVHNEVLKLPWPMAPLLMRYARGDMVPEWGPGQRLEAIILKGSGIIEDAVAETVEVVSSCRHRVKTEVLYCPVALYPADESLADLREIYGLWYQALTKLAERLPPDTPLLKRWQVDGLGAKPAPWKTWK